MKSNDRAMEKWALFYTFLKDSPTMKSSVLKDNLRGQISKTDFYDFLNVYEKEELIVRPTRGLILLVQKPGFWERRAERKRLENERKQQSLISSTKGYFRYRAEVDGVRFWNYVVKEEDRLIKKKG